MAIAGAVAVPHPPLIVPAVGRGEEKQIEATTKAYEQAAEFIRSLGPQTIVLLSPHATMYADYFHISPGAGASGDFGRFRAPQARFRVEYDTKLVDEISKLAREQDFPAGTLGERDATLDHGSMVPLYFLDEAGLADVKIIRVGLSGLGPAEHYRLGQLIQRAAADLHRKVVILASGDWSHKLKEDGPYGFAKEGPILDAKLQEIFKTTDFLSLLQLSPTLREAAAECGVGSFQIMAGALDGLEVKGNVLSYEGPFGVGYGIATFDVVKESPDRKLLEVYEKDVREKAEARKAAEDSYVKLARASLESYVRDGKVLRVPDNLPEELVSTRAGAFVSLKKDGRLRGCIGTIEATRPDLAQEIIANAVSAGCADPRFPAVTASELPELVYSVDVLGKAEPATMDELDAKKYGVIVRSGARRGLLLPNLEGVDTPQEQISIALQKGGIRPSEPYEIERFEVVRHK